MKKVFAVSGVHTSFPPAHQQPAFSEQFKKHISSDGDFLLMKKRLKHHQKLTPTAAGLLFSDAQHLLDNALMVAYLLKLICLMFVESLPGVTKQPAEQPQVRVAICLFYFPDCLVPGFFLMSILSSRSTTVIMVLSAWDFSFSHSSCFSSKVSLFSNSL